MIHRVAGIAITSLALLFGICVFTTVETPTANAQDKEKKKEKEKNPLEGKKGVFVGTLTAIDLGSSAYAFQWASTSALTIPPTSPWSNGVTTIRSPWGRSVPSRSRRAEAPARWTRKVANKPTLKAPARTPESCSFRSRTVWAIRGFQSFT